MSDGPYKSLQMRRWWKKVAEIADNAAYSTEEVRSRILEAIAKDMLRGIPRPFLRSILDALAKPNDFFDDPLSRIENLRVKAAGPMGQLFLDNILRSFGDEESGSTILEQALANTAQEQAMRGARQIEEHYRRNSPLEQADAIRARLNESIGAIGAADWRAVEISVVTGKKVLPRSVSKKSGLDDGVEL